MAKRIDTIKRAGDFEYSLTGVDEIYTLSIKSDNPLSPDVKKRISAIKTFSGLEVIMGIGKIEIQSNGNGQNTQNPLINLLNYLGLFQEVSRGYFPKLDDLMKTVDGQINRLYPALATNDQTDKTGKHYIDLVLGAIDVAEEEREHRKHGRTSDAKLAEGVKESLIMKYEEMELPLPPHKRPK
jgi:hypothetical protein